MIEGRNFGAKVAGDDAASHLVRTRFGIEFDAREERWPIDGLREVDVGDMRTLVSPVLLHGLERTLRDAARVYSWPTLNQFRSALRHFKKTIRPDGQIAEWKLADLRRYRAVVMEEYGHEDSLRHLRSLLVNWQKGRYPGVSDELIAALKGMRLKGAEAGRAVRVMDPDKGPLTPDELHALLQGLNDAAEAGRLALDEFALAYLHLLTGRRPIQSAQLKCKDVVERLGDAEPAFPEGRPLRLLAIPRAKQRGHAFRQTRRAVDLTLETFQLFSALRDSVQTQLKAVLVSHGFALQPADLQHLLDHLALFPYWPQVKAAVVEAALWRDRGRHGDALASLRADAAGSAWHRPSGAVSDQVARICQSVGARNRMGGALQITAARLRHTKGTDLAREGLPTHVIAWLLDHSTSRSAEIYVDNLPEHAAQINDAMAQSVVMQRFASAFRGELVDSESEARGGADPLHSRLTFEGQGAATCGHLKQCGLDGGIPHACYTCSHFQPWLDGPHERFLADLLTEREDAIAQLGQASPVARRRDRLITAVAQVVELCRTRRAELQGASSGSALEEAA